MAVRIVTDSSADLPHQLTGELRVAVVPLTVRFGREEFVDGRDLTPVQFWSRTASSPVLPETSAPSAGAFREVYDRLASEGADEIVSLHISSKHSATMQAAENGGRDASVPVRTLDTTSVSLGQGIVVREAALMAAAGASTDDIVAAVEKLTPRLEIHGCLDTLEYLRKGGRIGGARALMGSMLNVKPLITIKDGVVEAEGRARTRGKALASLVEGIKKQMPVEKLAVINGNAPDVDEFVEMLRPLADGDVLVGQVGPVVGTHSGPGLLAVAYFRG